MSTQPYVPTGVRDRPAGRGAALEVCGVFFMVSAVTVAIGAVQ
jgi:hypothetical protein